MKIDKFEILSQLILAKTEIVCPQFEYRPEVINISSVIFVEEEVSQQGQ